MNTYVHFTADWPYLRRSAVTGAVIMIVTVTGAIREAIAGIITGAVSGDHLRSCCRGLITRLVKGIVTGQLQGSLQGQLEGVVTVTIIWVVTKAAIGAFFIGVVRGAVAVVITEAVAGGHHRCSYRESRYRSCYMGRYRSSYRG